MALEYVFYSAAEIPIDQLHSLAAGALSGTVDAVGDVVCDGLTAYARLADPEDEAPAPPLFGFADRISVRFRFSNLRPDLEEHNTALMVGLVLGLNDRTRADGVLLLTGEEAVILCKGGEAIFAADWEDWDDFPDVVALRSGRTIAPVAQPLLSGR